MQFIKDNGAKTLAGLASLALFFWGFLALVRASNLRTFQAVEEKVTAGFRSGAQMIGPLEVDHSVCHYLIPTGRFEEWLNSVICAECAERATRVRSQLKVENLNGRCARRGVNHLLFRK